MAIFFPINTMSPIQSDRAVPIGGKQLNNKGFSNNIINPKDRGSHPVGPTPKKKRHQKERKKRKNHQYKCPSESNLQSKPKKKKGIGIQSIHLNLRNPQNPLPPVPDMKYRGLLAPLSLLNQKQKHPPIHLHKNSLTHLTLKQPRNWDSAHGNDHHSGYAPSKHPVQAAVWRALRDHDRDAGNTRIPDKRRGYDRGSI